MLRRLHEVTVRPVDVQRGCGPEGVSDLRCDAHRADALFNACCSDDAVSDIPTTGTIENLEGHGKQVYLIDMCRAVDGAGRIARADVEPSNQAVAEDNGKLPRITTVAFGEITEDRAE